jgi:hypothetical protein
LLKRVRASVHDRGQRYFDQRSGMAVNGSMDYLRVSGPIGDPNPVADIGAYEVQQDGILFNTNFDGC